MAAFPLNLPQENCRGLIRFPGSAGPRHYTDSATEGHVQKKDIAYRPRPTGLPLKPCADGIILLDSPPKRAPERHAPPPENYYLQGCAADAAG